MCVTTGKRLCRNSAKSHRRDCSHVKAPQTQRQRFSFFTPQRLQETRQLDPDPTKLEIVFAPGEWKL